MTADSLARDCPASLDDAEGTRRRGLEEKEKSGTEKRRSELNKRSAPPLRQAVSSEEEEEAKAIEAKRIS
jgi:hypothetical protein